MQEPKQPVNKTICKNIAFSENGECLMGEKCICKKNEKWLEETEDLSAPASPVEEIGQKLKLMREKEGLTPKDVLDKTGISLVYLDRLENGELKSHSASVLYKLSGLYKIDPRPLLVEAGVIIKKSDESKPSPVIEIGEQDQLADMLERIAIEVCPHDWENTKERMEYIEGAKNGAFRMHQILTASSNPAPAPIVGERTDKPLEGEMLGVLNKTSDRLFQRTAPTEQALPEEIKEFSENAPTPERFDFPENSAYDKGWEDCAIAFYHKMQPDIDDLIEHSTLFNRMYVEKVNELSAVREEAAQDKEKLSWEIVALSERLSAAREQVTSARTLILNIKIGNIYQEPADECDKWLQSNPEIK